MSIDARVKEVFMGSDGGYLRLEDRPNHAGGVPGIAGQSVLRFDAAPDGLLALVGLDVWGGSGEIMLGDVKIASRIGYTRIKFCDAERFALGVAEYRRTHAVA